MHAVLPRDNHVWLEQHGFEQHTLLEEGVEHGAEHDPGNLLAARDRVRSVHQHFRLDNGDKPLLLAERGVAREGVTIRAYARGTWQHLRNADDRSPLCEPGTHFAVGREALPKPVETLRNGFARGAGE